MYNFIVVKGAVTHCIWEGNRRSGVTLAMHPRFSGLFTYSINDLDREMSTPYMLQSVLNML